MASPQGWFRLQHVQGWMLMRNAIVLAVGLLACGSCARLEGYDVILCDGPTIYNQLGIDLEHREYGMSDFRSAFSYCSTNEYNCMRVPLLVSTPKGALTALDHTW